MMVAAWETSFEEAPVRKRASVSNEDVSTVKGLSQEEFKRIYDEVGPELEFETVYVVRPLRTRTATEVTAAAQELVLKLRMEGLHVSRVHSDRARELRVEPLRRWLLERGVLSTYTEGQAPQANGRAEAAVKWIKTSVKKLLEASGLGKENWAMAANYAVQERLESVLRNSKAMLPFGTKVHVRSKVYGTGGRYDLDSRWKAGSYVGPSLDVRGGHVIRFENGAYMTSCHLRPHLTEPDQIVDLEEYEVLLPVPTRRLRAKAGARDLMPTAEGDEPPMRYDPDHPAEQFALRLLEEKTLTPDQCEILAMMLPATAETPKRFGPQSGPPKIWSSGAFVHGGIAGVKVATAAFPASTRVFVKYVKQLQPDHKFNALALLVNIGAQPHVDSHNVGKNLIAGLSFFKGGGIEIEDPKGKMLLPLDDDHTHQLFDPKLKLSTKPWFGGSRVVLVAYFVRDSGKLTQDKVDYLENFGFDWIPHLSKPVEEEGVVKLDALRVQLMDTLEKDVPEQHRDSPEQEGTGGGDLEDGVPEQPRDSPEQEGTGGGDLEDDVPEQPRDSPEQEGTGGRSRFCDVFESMSFLTEDIEIAIGDLEDRAARLRDLLEEEEILCEEYRRLGKETREGLVDVRDQVSGFLDEVHDNLLGLERLKTMTCLKVAQVTGTSSSTQDVDYEEMLDALEEDLKIVHTVPTEQVKRYLTKWIDAIRKEVESLFKSGTLRRVSLEEARALEKESKVIFAPAKCVFTLKPPQIAGQKARRKCRLVICGNFVKDNLEFGDLYASGTSTDALRLSLVIAALKCWLGAVSDITGAFLLASWPPDLPKYGIYPPRVVRDSGVADTEAWIVERPLYGLRESPKIWSQYRNARLRCARIRVGSMVLVLRPTIAEPELWMILDEITGAMYGLMVLYVDDIAYFSTEEIIKATHDFIIEEWPASPLEWISEDSPVRYLGVEIRREPRPSDDGKIFWVYTIDQGAYVRELLREHNMVDVHFANLPAPREWIEQAEASDEVETDYDESTLKLAQRYVGECLWLATKTRPDIMFVTTHAASLVSKRPSYVIRVGERILAYLAGTADLRMTMGPTAEASPLELVAFTDASYAPYGRRSFGAAVITFAGTPVAWKSGRQSFITLSVMEAELYAATQGCTLLNSVEALVSEIFPAGVLRVLAVDNTSAAAMLAGGPGSQRTRHLKIRANYVREAVEQGRLVVRHTPGTLQLADLSTKMQSKVRLHQLLQLWGFVGFAVEAIKEFKMKVLSFLLVLAQCVCPSRAHGDHEEVVKEPLPGTGWEELLLACMITSVFAVVMWECMRWMFRAARRCWKRSKKARKLAQVARMTTEAVHEELKTAKEADALLRKRRPATVKDRREAVTTSPRTPPTTRTTSSWQAAGFSSPLTPLLPTTPLQGVQEARTTFEENERARVCHDVLMLMTVEELKNALRLHGQPVSGLKEDQVTRMQGYLMRADTTVKQLKYVLYLWRLKSLSYHCKLCWQDIDSKSHVSAWISTWKN